MWKTIKEGRHDSSFLPEGIHFGKTKETYEVIFDESCRYDLQDEVQQLDWNKLFGWSYGLHHKNSVRVVWRYNIELDEIELGAYIYKDSIRMDWSICSIKFNTKYIIEMEVSNRRHLDIKITGLNKNVQFNTFFETKPTWGYNLGLYFGGDNPAPHEMKVYLKKIKLC